MMNKKKITILAVSAALAIILLGILSFLMVFRSYSVPGGQGLAYDEAASIAFEQAGLTRQDVTLLRSQAEMDDGRWEYEVNFLNGFTQYTYQIDATTGMVTDVEIEPVFDFFD